MFPFHSAALQRPQAPARRRRPHAAVRLLLATALLTLLAGAHAPRVLASPGDACAAVQNEVDPPISDPEPNIGGRITDDATSAGVSGASVRLYACEDGSATLVATTTTDSAGDYAFEALTPGGYYVVEVLESGPLAGYGPTAGTANPTAAIPLGPSETDADLAFED